MEKSIPCKCSHGLEEHFLNSSNRITCRVCAAPIFSMSKEDWNLKKKELKFYWVHPYKRDNLRYLEQLVDNNG
jgi:hypothetical protein